MFYVKNIQYIKDLFNQISYRIFYLLQGQHLYNYQGISHNALLLSNS